jgi:hypothetical protein
MVRIVGLDQHATTHRRSAHLMKAWIKLQGH